jgi:hypothetical protein
MTIGGGKWDYKFPPKNIYKTNLEGEGGEMRDGAKRGKSIVCICSF